VVLPPCHRDGAWRRPPPTLDLANRDLIDSHLHAVWLAAAQVQLDTSIAPLLDLEKPDKPSCPRIARSARSP
jgi:hypothetical protein